MHLSGIHQVNHRLAVPLAYFFGGFGIRGQMDIQAALGKQSLGLNGGGKPLGCSMVERFRWFSYGEFHIHLDGVALVGPDFCPILAEGIPLLFITLHNFLQDVPIDGVLLADACQQRIDIRPAVGIVFGMPKSIIAAGLADQVVPLDQIAQEIILHVGVN